MRERKKGFTLLVLFVLSYLLMTLVVGAVFAQGETDTDTDDVTTEEVTEVETEAVEEVVEAEAVEADAVAEINNLDTVWMLVAGFMVFFMQAGFALLEAGFVRAKTVVNIFMKNFFDLSIGAIGYWALGFGLMFGAGNGFFGSEWFFLEGIPEVYPDLTVPTYAFFFFQFAFAATAATIASGAMAGRTDFRGYFVYSGMVTIFIYPIIGHWTWGGGWLADLGFVDFAGSTIVHSTGAWVGLMGAIVLGPRLNRFGENSTPMPGHSMTMAALGTFILWFGWFGFNPGSQLDADGASIAYIAVTTNLAGSAGAITAMLLGWYLVGKPQLPWALNGALAGLVSITASPDMMTPAQAILIGSIGGLIMYGGVNLLERFKIDDVVGAVSVHGFAGVWGTLAIGIFGPEVGLLSGGGFDQLITQIIGVVAIGAFVIITSGAVFFALNSVGWLRAEREGEILGLDIYEHGMVAYPEFTNSPSEPIPFN